MKVIESSLEWQLKLIHWQYFVSLTWSPDLHCDSPSSARHRHVKRWLTRWAAKYNLTLRDLLLTAVFEDGELGNKEHFHCLLSFPNKVSGTSAESIYRMWIWEHKEGCGHGRTDLPCRYGFARVRPCAPWDVQYMSEKDIEYSQRDNYEIRKFGLARINKSYISDAAWLAMLKARNLDQSVEQIRICDSI